MDVFLLHHTGARSGAGGRPNVLDPVK